MIKPSLGTIILQVVIALFFSLSLYWYLQSNNSLDELRMQLGVVENRVKQLKNTEKKLTAYSRYLGERPETATIPGKITWEKVEFRWQDISYRELLNRLEGVYSSERIFVLDSFSFNPAANRGASVSQPENRPVGRKFQLKGYYLCLCR